MGMLFSKKPQYLVPEHRKLNDLQGWALEKFTALANAIKELRKVNGTCISTKCPLKPVVQNGTH